MGLAIFVYGEPMPNAQETIADKTYEIVKQIQATQASATKNLSEYATLGNQESMIELLEYLAERKVNIFDEESDRFTSVGPFRELRVADIERGIGGDFGFTILDTELWDSALLNSATNVQSGGVMTMNSGTNSAGSAVLNTKMPCRFISNRASYYLGGIRLGDTGIASNTRRWGVFTVNNGYFFQLSGTTFSIVSRKAGVDTSVSSGSFNGNLGTMHTLDTNAATYEIYLVGGSVRFYIGFRLLHQITHNAELSSDTYHLPLRFENVNSGNTTNVTLQLRGQAMSRVGSSPNVFRHHNYDGSAGAITKTLKTGPGRLASVIVGRDGGGGCIITFYDSTSGSGEVISIISLTSTLNQYIFNIEFQYGLTYVISGTPANANVCITYD